jgi:hypothetical protein
MDPLAEKYPSVSPYAYALANPLKYIDPTGAEASPIYNIYGVLIGTDDKGLQGDAIIMIADYFTQGMSHEEALKYDLGKSALDKDALKRMEESRKSLSGRPDYDGYLTLEEANEWYRNGNGEALYVDLNKIDMSGVVSLGEKYVGKNYTINLLTGSGSINDGMVFGNVTFKRYPNHQARAYSDRYDFEMHSWWNPLNWGRNVETLIGRGVAGKGVGYEINIYGSKTLKPILPWIK